VIVEETNVNVFAIRHGETAWSLSGQHTGTTDIPLTYNGRRLAERIRPVLAREAFALVSQSRRHGHHRIRPRRVELQHSESLRPRQIRETAPIWLIFRDGCPGREASKEVGAWADRVIARARAADGELHCSHTSKCCACLWRR
jgi:broad specificity phosphatase PhoE